MKYYIATRLENAAGHNALRDLLNGAGHKLTYDWTRHGSVKDKGRAVLAQVAENEIEGVREADFVVALLPGGRGTHTEIGAALALGKPTIIHDSDARTDIDGAFSYGAATCSFYHHPLALKLQGSSPLAEDVEGVLLYGPCSSLIEIWRRKIGK